MSHEASIHRVSREILGSLGVMTETVVHLCFEVLIFICCESLASELDKHYSIVNIIKYMEYERGDLRDLKS